MTSKELQIIGLIIAIPLIGYALWVNRLWAEPDPPKPSAAFEIMVEQKKADVVEVMEVQTMMISEMTDEQIGDELDMELLARCVEAEAGNQSLLGRRLVVDVILNRVESGDFPNTIRNVIRQPNQFTSVSNQTIYTVTPSELTYQAILLESEHRTDYDVIYFRTGRFSDYGTPVEQVGAHYFSR